MLCRRLPRLSWTGWPDSAWPRRCSRSQTPASRSQRSCRAAGGGSLWRQRAGGNCPSTQHWCSCCSRPLWSPRRPRLGPVGEHPCCDSSPGFVVKGRCCTPQRPGEVSRSLASEREKMVWIKHGYWILYAKVVDNVETDLECHTLNCTNIFNFWMFILYVCKSIR